MICANCVGEAYLKDKITAEGEETRCTFCRQRVACMDDETFTNLLQTVIFNQFHETSREP